MNSLSYIWEGIKSIASIIIAYLIINYFYNSFEIVIVCSLIILYIYLLHGLKSIELDFLKLESRQYYRFKELCNMIKYPEEDKIDTPVFSKEYINKMTDHLLNKNKLLTDEEMELNGFLELKKINFAIQSVGNWIILAISFFYIITTIY